MTFIKHNLCIVSIITIIIAVFSLLCCANNITIYTKPGQYLSPNKQCVACLGVSEQGGFIELSVLAKNEKSEKVIIASDITGITWFGNSDLIYSVSPLYGKPGIYKINCSKQNSKPIRILAPMTYNKHYPDGADYFELHSVVGNKIFYYYGKDVENIDFNKFRINSNLLNHVVD